MIYEKARPWAKAIAEKVAVTKMPPWHAESIQHSNTNIVSTSEAIASHCFAGTRGLTAGSSIVVLRNKLRTNAVYSRSVLREMAKYTTLNARILRRQDAHLMPILQKNCQECHRPFSANLSGMVAPLSLTDYEEARPWAKTIAEAVTTKTMPPWFATPEGDGFPKIEKLKKLAPASRSLPRCEAGAVEGDNPRQVVETERGLSLNRCRITYPIYAVSNFCGTTSTSCFLQPKTRGEQDGTEGYTNIQSTRP